MTLADRLAPCDEATCLRKGRHDFHADARGRTWAYRNVPDERPLWVRLAAAHELRARDLSGVGR